METSTEFRATRAIGESGAAPRVAGQRRTRVRASVVIVNYNGRAYLEKCLRGLLDDEDGDHEIILVDNASTDGSAEYVAGEFPEVRLVRSRVNLGFAQGCNLGARCARGKYLAFLNPDTVVEPGWLGALCDALGADPRAGLAGPKVLLLKEPDQINTCGNEMHYTGLTLCRGLGMDQSAFSEPEELTAVSGAAFAIRHEIFDALGGFDEDFFMYVEDTDLSVRARLAGYKCLYVPQSVVHHDYALHFGPQKTDYQERNRYMMLVKVLRWRSLVVLAPALLLAEVVTWGFVLLRDGRRFANKPRAYLWIARHWRELLASRRQVQRSRQIPDRDLLEKCAHGLAYEQTGDGAAARLAHVVFDP